MGGSLVVKGGQILETKGKQDRCTGGHEMKRNEVGFLERAFMFEVFFFFLRLRGDLYVGDVLGTKDGWLDVGVGLGEICAFCSFEG